MLTYLRTLSTRWLRRPRALVVRAWFWLAAHADSLDEKRRCLEALQMSDSVTMDRLIKQSLDCAWICPADQSDRADPILGHLE